MSIARRSAVIGAVAAVFSGAGCTSGPHREDPAPAVSPPVVSAPVVVATSAVPPAPLRTPKEAKGELARVVMNQGAGYPDVQSIISRSARAGQEYWLHAACTSTASGTTLSFKVHRSQGSTLAKSDILCDGQVTVDGLGTLGGGKAISLDLGGDDTSVTGAYGFVSPSPSTPGR